MHVGVWPFISIVVSGLSVLFSEHYLTPHEHLFPSFTFSSCDPQHADKSKRNSSWGSVLVPPQQPLFPRTKPAGQSSASSPDTSPHCCRPREVRSCVWTRGWTVFRAARMGEIQFLVYTKALVAALAWKLLWVEVYQEEERWNGQCHSSLGGSIPIHPHFRDFLQSLLDPYKGPKERDTSWHWTSDDHSHPDLTEWGPWDPCFCLFMRKESYSVNILPILSISEGRPCFFFFFFFNCHFMKNNI